MSIQDDNTFATKGDLKNLYTNKIAPYLGGGINYYYTDRTGEELKSINMELAADQSVSAGSPQNTLINFDKVSGSYNVIDHKVSIPGEQRIQIDATLQAVPGATNNVDGTWEIYDYTNNTTIAQNVFTFYGSGYSWCGTKTVQYDVPSSGALIGIKVTGLFYATKIFKLSSFTIQEIGRIVDPVKYVSNNSDLQETPVGNIISYMGNTVPKHYLACDGTTYSIGSYPELEDFIINEFDSINYFGGDGSTTWAVPDLRGEFLRGSGTNSHTNQGSGGDVGKHQDGTTIPYTFNVSHPDGNCSLIAQKLNSDVRPGNADKELGSSVSAHWIQADARKTDSWAQNGATSYATRPTNTSVKYCIKYESTYHAFFSNAAYKVSVKASVTSSNNAQVVFDSSDIIGDSNLISGDSLITPMDGWYSLGMNWTQGGSGDVGYYIRVNGNNAGYNRGILVNNTLYLQKGDVVTINKESGTDNSGRVNFCLLTSNYNPTIVSADSVYSKNEQMIGYWEDGKPLYQRTLVYNNRVLGADINTDLNKNTINIIDYDFIHYANSTPTGDVVNKGGCHPQGASTWASWLYFVKSSDSNYWKVASRVGSSLGVSTCSFTITVRYTKTTDTASLLQVENSLLLNRPDLWTPGTEYHFGGGLYGMRKTGTITSVAAGGRADVVIISNLSNVTIVNSGGMVGNSNYEYSVPSTHVQGNREQFIWYNKTISGFPTNSIFFYIGNSTTSAITNETYDVWVTYKK